MESHTCYCSSSAYLKINERTLLVDSAFIIHFIITELQIKLHHTITICVQYSNSGFNIQDITLQYQVMQNR